MLTKEERQLLIDERKSIEERMSKSAFISPKDYRRTQGIMSLLMSDGKTIDIRLKAGKPRQSNRVTSFTRDRR